MKSRLGAQLTEEGTRFGVWAPHAQAVSVIGSFNNWDEAAHPMQRKKDRWELFISGVGEGERYKFAVTTAQGRVVHKADPYAYMSEVRPKNASVVFDVTRYRWGDQNWKSKPPLAIYEVHLGSWRRGLNYRELAHQLADYCADLGFTHVELLPITEHPLDESWGYQVSGYFAPTSRFGTPEDFQYFVDHLHQRGLGVFLDWVPGHFPQDDWALAEFDGTCLYEHEDHGLHPHWETKIFDYGRPEVAEFLIESALYWIEVMHIDGLRVDAVASMLHLDFGREEGEWSPNHEGGNYNLEAIDFLKKLCLTLHERHPGILLMAEESHTFPGVTEVLGFDLKWDLGWMHDTLNFLQSDRMDLFNHLTFGHTYRYTERFMLPLSHDEVVHLKKSLLAKMPGDAFARLRLLLHYLYCQPGPKLLFMGGEFGQLAEWNEMEELQWHLLEDPRHKGIQDLVRELNGFYRAHPALWELDHDPAGFEWESIEPPVLAYWRRSSDEELLCVHNFSGEPQKFRSAILEPFETKILS